ncbi:MAG: HD domain-containing protein [Candidatus Thorarchaeota archaeon]|jgi:uncharacterized protein
MKSDLEEKLINLVKIQTSKAAINEWSKALTTAESPLFDYRFDHVENVVHIVKQLARDNNADINIVTIAGWLHDIAKPGMESKQDHGILSSEIALEVLRKEGVEEKVIEAVCDIIRKHVGLTLDEPLSPIEAQILWEADKLVKLGIIGFIHSLVYYMKFRPGISSNDLAKEFRDYIPLAERIAASMETDSGKSLARQRLRNLKRIIESLELETSLVFEKERE